MRIIYLMTEGISSTVFVSQVYSLFKELKFNKIDITLVIYQPIKANYKLINLLSLIFKKDIKFIFFKNRNHELLEKKVSKLIKNDKCIIHSRGPIAAYIGYKLCEKFENVSLLYDVRGLVEDDIKFSNETNDPKQNAEFNYISSINQTIFHTSSQRVYFNFVCNELYLEYKKRFKFNNLKYIVCPSVANHNVFKYSYKRTFVNEINAIYIGGTQSYQNIEQLIHKTHKVFNKLFIVTTRKLILSDIQFYDNVCFLTELNEKEIMRLVDSNNIDYGLLYRDNIDLNFTATPTKISEYWNMGLKVLVFGNAGAYTQIINENNFLGKIFNTTEYIQEYIIKVSNEEKALISNYALGKYSLSKNVKEYINFYKQILQ